MRERRLKRLKERRERQVKIQKAVLVSSCLLVLSCIGMAQWADGGMRGLQSLASGLRHRDGLLRAEGREQRREARELSGKLRLPGTALLSEERNEALKNIMDVAVKNSGTKLIAHRGYSSEAPENTLPAYELAAQKGAWGVEADIRRTADGEFVCIHDDSVDRMTDGTGKIEEMTLAEIRSLTVKEGSNIASYPDTVIPTMEEYLDVCKRNGVNAVLDLKFDSVEDVAPLMERVRASGMEEMSVCLSENMEQLRKIRGCSSVVRVKYLVNEGTQVHVDEAASLSKSGLAVSKISPEMMAYAREKGLSINVWTYNEVSEKNEWTSRQVDFLTTDDLST